MPATRPVLLSPEFLAQLERLSLYSRRVFRGRVKGERVAEGWAPTRGRGHVVSLLEFLGRVTPAGGTRLDEGLQNYAVRARDPGLAVVISDLLDPVGFESGVRALLERRFDVHLVHVLAPA